MNNTTPNNASFPKEGGATSTPSDAFYHCPLCPSAFADFEQCIGHMDKHSEFDAIYLNLQADLKRAVKSVELPFSNITPAELLLLKGNVIVDGDAEAVRFPAQDNEWIAKLLTDKAMDDLEVI